MITAHMELQTELLMSEGEPLTFASYAQARRYIQFMDLRRQEVERAWTEFVGDRYGIRIEFYGHPESSGWTCGNCGMQIDGDYDYCNECDQRISG